jgi:uncharacterized protein (TIGR03437 family)
MKVGNSGLARTRVIRLARHARWLAGAYLLLNTACGQVPAALDPSGNLWRVGRVNNTFTCGTFKVPPGILENIPCGDAIVTELDPTGTAVLYTTTLGGHGDSGGVAITADSVGNTYVAGYTTAPDFPVTSGVLQGKNAGPNTSRMDQSSVLPGGDAFIVKLNPDGSVAYSTFLGGSGNDIPTAISVDSTGLVYIVGSTSSPDFPLTSTPLRNKPSGGFVAKIAPDGQSLNFSTYFPASIYGLAVDSAGAVYMTGFVDGAVLTTPGSLQPTFGGGPTDAFAVKISSSGSLIYSTYLGGSQNDSASAIAVDSQGAAWIGGQTGSPNFPGTSGTGGAFLVKVSPDGTAIQTGSRFGPGTPNGFAHTTFVAVDSLDNVYASGDMNQFAGAFSASGFQPTPNAQLHIPCESFPSFLIEADSDGTPLYTSYLRQVGTIFVTAPSHLLIYGNTFSNLDLTSSPVINFQCPVNSASYTVPIAPGEIVSIFGYGLGPETGIAAQPDSDGRYPTFFEGVEVQFNGVSLPLLYVQAALINTVVPKNPRGGTIQVSYQGQSAPPLNVSGQSANPGVFVVMNQDWTVNSQANPAKFGSIISVFATGIDIEGVNFPDGQVAPLAPLLPFDFALYGDAVSFTGIPGIILWEGAAPGLIFGVDQINVQLPESLSVTAPFSSVPMIVKSSYLYSSPPFVIFVAP